MQSKFKTENQINNLFKKAFDVLRSKGYKQADRYFKQAFVFNPYPLEVHYQLALYFASQKNEKLLLNHLAVCYDIDNTYLEKALQEPIMQKNFKIDFFKQIKENELSRMWQVMKFQKVEPSQDFYDLILKIKKGQNERIKNICENLPERVKRYFSLNNTKINGNKIIKNKITLESDGDRNYCGYEKVYLALKKLSPFVEDVRFFMSSESMCWMDEIRIKNGIFFSHRYLLATDYSAEQLELFEKLAVQNKKDVALKHFLSYKFLKEAEFSIDDNEKNEPEVKIWLKKARYFFPKNNRLDYVWAKYYWEKSDFKKAKAFLLKASKKQKNSDVFYKLGSLALQDSDYPLAIKYFARAIKIHPELIDAIFYKGLAYGHLKKDAKAFREYKKVIDQLKNYFAADLVRKGNKLLSNNLNGAFYFYSAAINKARLYKKELEKRAANHSGKENAELFDRLKKQTDDIMCDAYIGASLTVKTSWEKLKYCNKALEKNPQSVIALYNKGVILQEMKKFDEAEKNYDLALSYDGNYIKALNNKYVLLELKKKYPEALLIAKKMVEINPTYSNGWLNLGNVYIFLKKYLNAVPAYKQLIKLEPGYEKGYHGLGAAYAWLKKHRQCIEVCKKALKINPNLSEVISNIAGSYNNLGKPKQALFYTDKSIKLNPNYYHPYYVKACVYAKTNRIDDALKMINKTLAIDSSQLELLRHEPDFEKLRKNKEFKNILGLLK